VLDADECNVKIRRVKCGEEKPYCLRCQKFGRTCDGYAALPSRRGPVVAPIQPRTPSLSLYSPSSSIHGTEDESRYFQAFVEFSARELPGYFDADFWSRVVLQESHAVASIRHAVIAIGALNRGLEKASRSLIKANVIQDIDKRHHEHAVLHHLKAVQSLNRYLSMSRPPQLRVALISCLLFICFETLLGSYASGIQQTYGGLKILRSYFAGRPGSKPRIPQRNLPQRFLPDAKSRSGQVSKALQTRQGCDNIYKARVIALHVEQYLEVENNPRLDGEKRGADCVEQVAVPLAALTGTDYSKEQQQMMMSAPTNDHTLESSSASADQFVQTAAENSIVGNTTFGIPAAVRKSSSILSKSTVSTPGAHSFPESPRHPSSISPSQAPFASIKRPLESIPVPPILHHDLDLEESLIQTLVRLEGNSIFFGMPPGIPPLVWDVHRVYHLPIPSSFPDFSSAQRSWDFLMDRALKFYRRTFFNKTYAPTRSDPPAKIASQFASFMRQLSAFEKAFRPFLSKAIEADGTICNPAALVISLYQKCTLITLATVCNASEMVYDSFFSEFQYITRTCSRLARSQRNSGIPKDARFTFEVGLVPPLHVTATKCRDPTIRREAIELLLATPRQEGMWDGVLSGMIGEWIASCEEEGLSPPPLGSSQQPSVHVPPREYEAADDKGFSSPGGSHLGDEIKISGGWENGKRMSKLVIDAVGGDFTEYASDEPDCTVEGSGIIPSQAEGRRERPVLRSGWTVPEKNRVQLMVVDFHIPERFIKVKCQGVLVGDDGTRKEREKVIYW